MGRLLSLLALLLAMGLVLWLFVGKAQRDVTTVRGYRLEAPSNVPPQSFSAAKAEELLHRLEALLRVPQPPEAELAAIAQQATAWVAGSQPGTAAYRVAVALRAACLALAQTGPEAGDPQRRRAEQELATARQALRSAGPSGVTQGLQDQLKNLQVQQGEELSRALEQSP